MTYRTGLCALCYDVFEFLPGLAPTTERDNGTSGAICKNCNDAANLLRAEMKLTEIVVSSDTYREVLVS